MSEGMRTSPAIKRGSGWMCLDSCFMCTFTHICAHTDVLSHFLSLSLFKTELAWGRCSSNVHRKEGGMTGGPV